MARWKWFSFSFRFEKYYILAITQAKKTIHLVGFLLLSFLQLRLFLLLQPFPLHFLQSNRNQKKINFSNQRNTAVKRREAGMSKKKNLNINGFLSTLFFTEDAAFTIAEVAKAVRRWSQVGFHQSPAWNHKSHRHSSSSSYSSSSWVETCSGGLVQST